jgi:hypothetical protein
MSDASGDRSKFFPAIEKKHGQPVSHFLDELSELTDAKYAEQIAHLRENHGFSQAHANALVMHFRGSTSSKRFATPKQYFAQLDPLKKKTAELIFAAIKKKIGAKHYGFRHISHIFNTVGVSITSNNLEFLDGVDDKLARIMEQNKGRPCLL